MASLLGRGMGRVMGRFVGRVVRFVGFVGWALLGASALAGLVVAGVVLFALTPAGGSVLAAQVVRLVDDAVKGSLSLQAAEVLPDGRVVLHGVVVKDPDGDDVLRVREARIFLDVRRLGARDLGIAAEIEDPFVDLGREEDGSLALANAFGSAHPGPEEDGGPSRWTLRFTSVRLSGAEVRASRLGVVPDLAARDVALTGRGFLGPGGAAGAELKLRGGLEAPFAAPLALDADLSLERGRLRATTFVLGLRENAIELVGEADLATLVGRVAVIQLGIARTDLSEFVPGAKALGGNLAGGLYAEADGEVATVALRLVPPAGEKSGRADATAALRLPPARFAVGFAVATDGLDPARVVGAAPAGAVTLRARGAAAGGALDVLRGSVDLEVAPSRIGRGTFGPVTLSARADRGSWDVSKLDGRIPGLVVKGGGRWRRGGAVSGAFDLDARDVASALRAITAISGVSLPDFAGRARIALRLAGTSAQPAIDADVDAESFRTGGLAIEGARLTASLSGPLRAPDLGVRGTVATLRTGGKPWLRRARLQAQLVGREGAMDVVASVPGVATEPFAVHARARLGPDRDRLLFSELAVAWPKTRYTMARPAELRFEGPTVDRLELVSGAQRIAVSGGFGARGRLDARAELAAVDLARLPPGLLPEDLGLAGALTLDATATGTTSQPILEGRLALAEGAVHGISGLAVVGTARWDGAKRRAAADLEARRAAGGSVAVRGELPIRLSRARPSERLDATARVEGIAIEDLLRVLEVELPAAGIATAEVKLAGTVGAPRLEATAAVEGGRYGDLAPVSVRVALEDPGEEARLEVAAEANGVGAVAASGTVPLDLFELISDPAPTFAALRKAPAKAQVRTRGLDLAGLAGRFGIPRGVAGRLTGEADVQGSFERPRGTVRVQLAEGAFAGYTRLGATGQVTLGADRIAVEALGAIGSDALVQVDASLGAPLQRILSMEELRRAPIRVDVTVPKVALERASGPALPLAGTVEAAVRVTGTLAAPVAELTARGDAVAVRGRPFGAVTASARYAEGRGTGEALVSPAAGGTLRATFGLTAGLGLGGDGAKLADAPARARLVADGVGLGILAALAPGTIRSAGGRLDADLTAEGPLGRLRPRGDVRIEKGEVAVAGYGDWSNVTAEANLREDEAVLRRFSAGRKGGTLEVRGAIRGLRAETATLEASAKLEKLPVVYEGQDAATVELDVAATGTLRGPELRARVELERGLVRVPSRTPRSLQSISNRPDIVVGRPEEKKAPAEGTERPFHAEVDIVIPARLQIVCEDPRYDLTLRGDTQLELAGGDVFAEGAIEVVRGEVEPLGGRLFEIERGRVQFTGGPPRAAVLDAQAVWRATSAGVTVTVTVTGPVLKPTIKLSSQPPLDDASIATLIATGRSTLKPGAATGTLTAAEAGGAAAGAIASQLLDDVLLKQLPLPVDTVAVDTGSVRAGTYLNDRVYVGYTRRFDAQEEQNENRDEFRVEYQISPRWTLEGEVGDKRSSGSLIWSRNY